MVKRVKGLRGGSYTVEAKKLSSEQKKHISSSILPRLNAAQLNGLYITIEHAWSHDALHHDFIPQGETKRELKLFKGHFIRSLKALETLETEHETSILDHLFAEETGAAIKEISQQSALRLGKPACRSGIEWMITAIIESIEIRENEFITNSEGGRSRAKRYQKLVRELMSFFQSNIKEIKISSTPNGPFSMLILYIFSNVLDLDNPDPKRTIDNIIIESRSRKKYT